MAPPVSSSGGLPPPHATKSQSTIRSFFQPKTPSYAPPPSSSSSPSSSSAASHHPYQPQPQVPHNHHNPPSHLQPASVTAADPGVPAPPGPPPPPRAAAPASLLPGQQFLAGAGGASAAADSDGPVGNGVVDGSHLHPSASGTNTGDTSNVPRPIAPLPPLPRAPSQMNNSLPPQASIQVVREAHIPALRRINALLLPVAYPDNFYRRVLDPDASAAFSRVVVWRDDVTTGGDGSVVGGIVCHAQVAPFAGQRPNASGAGKPLTPSGSTAAILSPRSPPPATNGTVSQSSSPGGSLRGENALYIQSLVLLSPYRRLGLAAAMLDAAVNAAASLPAHLDIGFVYAHVWTANEEALRWYLARGFVPDPEPVRGYYFRLKPDTAWIVRRKLVPDAVTAVLSTDSTTCPREAVEIPRSGPVAASVTAAAANLPPISSGTVPAVGKPPAPPVVGQSFQNRRPDTDWNDLPADMVGPTPGSGNVLGLPGRGSGAGSSNASSRSSSVAGRKKKERAYPAAAFGN